MNTMQYFHIIKAYIADALPVEDLNRRQTKLAGPTAPDDKIRQLLNMAMFERLEVDSRDNGPRHRIHSFAR